MDQQQEKHKEEEKDFLSFLELTKDGTYAKIEDSSLPYSRVKERTIIVHEQYEYSYR